MYCRFWYLLLIIFLVNINSLKAQNWTWAHASNNGTGAEIVNDAAQDDQGNIYMIGTTSSQNFDLNNTTIGNNGNEDIFVIKMSSTGTVVWSKNIGGTLTEQGAAIDVDASGNVYIMGSYTSTSLMIDNIQLDLAGERAGFVAKLSANGTALWARRLSTTSASYAFKFHDILSTSNGPIISLSSFGDYNIESENIYDASATRIIFTQFDSDGNTTWNFSNIASNNFCDIANGMLVETSNDSLIFAVSLNSGDMTFTGDPTLHSGDFLLSYKNGQIGWVHHYDEHFTTGIEDFKINTQNEFFLSLGNYDTGLTISIGPPIELPNPSRLLKLSSTGVIIHDHVSDAVPSAFKSIHVDGENIITTGSFSERYDDAFVLGTTQLPDFGSPVSGQNYLFIDGFVGETDKDGNFTNAFSFGGNNFEHSNFIFKHNNAVTVIGSFDCAELPFGDHSVYNSKASTTWEHVGIHRLNRNYSTFIATYDNSLNIEESETSNLSTVYPNPNKGSFWLTDLKKNQIIKIFDPLGKCLFSKKIENNTPKLNINLSNQTTGIYYLTIYNREQSKTMKIILN